MPAATLTVTAQLKIAVNAIFSAAQDSASIGALAKKISIDLDMANGTAKNQIDIGAFDAAQVANGATDVLLLNGTTGTAITDPAGDEIAMVVLNLVLVKNIETTAAENLQVGPDASNGVSGMFADASDRIIVEAEGWFLWFSPNGIAVTDNTSDELAIINASGTAAAVDYEYLVLGQSA